MCSGSSVLGNSSYCSGPLSYVNVAEIHNIRNLIREDLFLISNSCDVILNLLIDS